MRRVIASAALTAVFAALLLSSPASSGSELVRTASTPRVTATLAPELAVAAPGSRVPVVLHKRLLEGWHTYWENPGDSGQGSELRWTLPEGVTAGALRYPVPDPIRYGSLMNHGYSGEAALLTHLDLPADWPAGKPLALEAHATWLVCADVCIPEEARFAFTLPTAQAQAPLDEVKELFAQARARLPAPAPWPVSLRREGAHLVLAVQAPGISLDGAWLFSREWGHLAHPAQQVARASTGGAELVLTPGEAPPRGEMQALLRVAPGEGYLLTLSVPAPAAASASAAPTTAVQPLPRDDPGTALLLLLALAGGVLLNLMPCVFPVLAMKAMSFIGHAGEGTAARVGGGLAYTAGVLVSFGLLAAVLLALKAGGAAVGWGFHLQSPGVVAVLALVLFAVGLNLSGLLQVGGAWSGAGSQLAARGGLTGSFFTGVLAAVVAAPCTAPFMATAIGVALLQSTSVAVSVFLALGFGLAVPYLVLTCVPALADRLPRPGAWMQRLRELLAFPMYASAAWLIWVLAQQAGADAVGLALLAMVAIALAAHAWREASRAPRRGAGLVLRSLAGASALAALVALVGAGSASAPSNAAPAPDGIAERYDAARIESVLAGGGAVFLNVTAAWCVTCKVNEGIALSGDGFREALERTGVTYMKGDWTRRDPDITALLTRFGRAGVPLYVIFPRDGGAPRVLPQVLTGAMVRAALADA